jgi:sulfite oxidase
MRTSRSTPSRRPRRSPRRRSRPPTPSYVRSHGPVPTLDPRALPSARRRAGASARSSSRSSELRDGAGSRSRRSWPRSRARATAAPAWSAVRPVPGELVWGSGAVEHGAVAAGVALADVLAAAGRARRGAARRLRGADESAGGRCRRSASAGPIPLAKALGPEVLLAWELNGAPLRARPRGAAPASIVPGYVGAPQREVARARIEVRPRAVGRILPAHGLPAPAPRGGAGPGVGMALGELARQRGHPRPADARARRAGRVGVSGLRHRGGAARSPASTSRRTAAGRGCRRDRRRPRPWAWRPWRLALELAPGARARRAARGAAPPRPARHARRLWNRRATSTPAWPRVPCAPRDRAAEGTAVGSRPLRRGDG